MTMVVVLSQMIADDRQCIIYVNKPYVWTPAFTRLILLICADKLLSTRAYTCVHTLGLMIPDRPRVRRSVSIRMDTRILIVHTPVHTSSIRIGTSSDTPPWCSYG